MTEDHKTRRQRILDEKIRCDACPVMCLIADGKSGACDRYANADGKLIRLDPLVIIERTRNSGGHFVPFLNTGALTGEDNDSDADNVDDTIGDQVTGGNKNSANDKQPSHLADQPAWNGDIVHQADAFITAIGAGTTYPDYKPAPFIVSSQIEGVDMVTAVTEGIFSYCGVKVKIDTDRHLGPERNIVRARGEAVGHVTTGEYGSQMLSLGGVNHLTGGSKKEGRITCETLLALCNREAVELEIDEGSTIIVQAGKAPVVNSTPEERMRVGCGSATVGMFASQWHGLVDEVVVVDDHITGVVSEHQAGKVIGWPATGIKIKGRKSTPGRYFKVAQPGTGWGGTDIDDPLTILADFNPKFAKPGQSLLMVSTTGEQFAYFELDESLKPIEQTLPEQLKPSVMRIEENCEPALCTVMFMGGAGGSLRSGVTENPVMLTRSVKQTRIYITCAGAPAYVWPGGGITIMADVTRMPDNAFGYVPTPALVAPIEFTMRRDHYLELGGHEDHILAISQALKGHTGLQNDHLLTGQKSVDHVADNPWPTRSELYGWHDDNA